MKYLKIQNNGELDIRLVALMGGTTKANDKYKIGQFGTGLKYTLAFLFRENLDFKIFCGENNVDISLEKEDISGTTFEILCIEGKRTSITTQMGKEWTAWMILRELWCNALDEKGELKETVNESSLVGEAGKTTFYIQVNTEIQEVLDNWGKYFIDQRTALWDSKQHSIYVNRSGNLRLYKNGVLIYQHPNIDSLFCYDIKDAEINEMREFKGMVSYEVMNALREPNEDVISYFLGNVSDSHYEGSEMDYSWFTSFANIWKNTVGDRRLISSGSDWTEGVETNFANVVKLPKKVYAALTKQFEGLGVLARTDSDVDFFEASLPLLKQKAEECMAILSNAGYKLDGLVKYGIFSDKRTLHACSWRSKVIMLCELVEDMPIEKIMKVLVEENESIALRTTKKEPAYYRGIIGKFVSELLRPQETPIEYSGFSAK